MPKMLSELVDTAVGFRAAVNLVNELHDLDKAAAFLPTKHAAEVLFDLGRQMEPRGGERARLVTGTYGTGKSHLALVLANLYRGHAEALDPVLGRLSQKFPGRYEPLMAHLAKVTPESPYLVVAIEGDQDSFDAALVRGLRKSLDHAGMADFMPHTYFEAAAERLRGLLEDVDASERLSRACSAEGWASADALLAKLESDGVELTDLEAFQRVHQQVCFGAFFSAEAQLNASETYQEAADALVAKGQFLGIVVIWDEFGSFMEQIVRDPGSEGLAVQKFAETCQNSGESQLHFYAIAHRTLASYARRAKDSMHLTSQMTDVWEQDFKKVSGRFHEFIMESESEELFTLIDDVLIQRRADGWESFLAERDSDFAMMTDDAYRAELLPDLPSSKLRSIVVEGCYPLAPVTTAILPRIAELVAQNQRTLFTFLCGDHPGTAATFLKSTPIPAPGEPLPLIYCDHVWDYFSQQIREDRIGQQTYRRYRAALSTIGGESTDPLTERILKVLALFDLLREGDPQRAADTPANEGMVLLALGAKLDADVRAVKEKLAELIRPGATRVAVRAKDKTYRLVTGGGTELAEALQQALEERKASLKVADFIRSRWGRTSRSQGVSSLGYEERIEVLGNRSDTTKREVEVVVLLPEETGNLSAWTRQLGGGDFRDGLLFVVLPTDQMHIGAISKTTLEHAENMQVLFARPPDPLVGLREVVAQIDALETVARQEPTLWGTEGQRRDEWDAEYEEAMGRLTDLLAPAALGVHATTINLECVWRGSSTRCRGWAQVVELAEKAMETAFALCPKSNDEIMRPAVRDGLASARRVVVDKLLEPTGPILVARERDQAQLRLARLLQSIQMLKTAPRPLLSRPVDDSGAAAIWDYIEQVRDDLRQSPCGFDGIVRKLRAAPYGLSTRVIPLLIMAVLRDDIRAGNIIIERSVRNGDYQAKNIDGTALDEAVADPANHRLRYVNVTEMQFDAIEGLLIAVAGEAASPGMRSHLLDETKQQVTIWWSRTPGYCQNTTSLSPEAHRLRDLILRPLVHPEADAHAILVEKLRELIDTSRPRTRDDFAQAFGGLIAQIEGVLGDLPGKVATELSQTLAWGPALEPAALCDRLAQWYGGLPVASRDWCHPHDAGKLQAWLRGDQPCLETLCESVIGKALTDWADSDSGHFVGRVQAAMEAITKWEPSVQPPLPPGGGGAQPGAAVLSITAGYKDGSLELRRQFATIEHDDLSETAKVLLRLLTTNLADDHSLRDGERENLLVELARRVFGDA